MGEKVDGRMLRLAFWADIMVRIKQAGMSWPGFSHMTAEWARLEPLSPGVGTRGNLSALGYDAGLWAKVVFQMRRVTLILCGFLVPGALLLIAYNIDGGPIITALKWASWIAMLISSGETARRHRAAMARRTQKV
jgi:hypothetical protein